ncbi:speckle targeted PIP5K1A-regulated poly(A) polymerase-like isoform X2 [Portunus trituberculatus]|uniref:speckle targeted PIP5K1A-regulated poly(A) polymerase-like isoform X2 n=1 Tax=Portunus trituberculatus TaxID=210409 RepID=UPI001E1CC201|nr:speckle targeted PIP5K1A-regulated poly(A) polymerase-like isoform X2 [Portunus trituberculatus]
MEGAKSTAKTWARKCIVCDVNFSYKHAYILHLLGKRHQKNVRKRDRSQVNTVRNRTVCFSGRRDKITLEKIVEYFLEYGVNNVIQQGNTVFIEFDSVETAKIVLEKRNYHIRTVSLRVFPMKDTIKDEATKVPISPSLKNCMSQAVSGSELIKYISFLIKEIELKPREHEARENLRRGIVNYLTPYFPKVVGHIFGSAANNLGFTGCDVDIYLDLGVYPWIEYESKAAQAAASDLTWFLAKRIRQSGHAIKVEAVPRARVPIVKFQDRASGIMVDLSFRHGMPVYNTQLIYQYTQTHPLVRPYLMLIRYWAKVQGVAGGGKPSLLITNYALTMMMLFHLMHRGDPIVPSLAALRCNRATYTPVFIGPWDVGFSNYMNDWFVKVHRVTVMDLVSEFFSFYGEMDASQWVISPLTGMLLARDDVLTMSRNLPACLNTYLQQDDKIRLDTELCVQDPFEHSHNCTRGLIKSSFLEFQYKCRKAASISKNILKGEQTLNDLFQSIEVTPDMISDECQSSSQLKEDNEVITLDDSDVSQDIEVLDIQEGLAQSENMMTNSEGTSDIEILLTTKRTPDIEILSDPQETSQDLEILASSQESVDLSQNSIKKEQELESFRKRTNENKQSCSSGEAFEDCKKSQDKAMIDLSSTTGEGSGASQMSMENNSSHPLMLSNLGVCSKFLLDYSKVPVFLITPDGNIHRKNLNEHADTGQAACSFIQFVLQQCLKIDLSTVENCLTAEKRKALMQGDETTVEKYKKENDGNSVPVPLKYQRLTKYMCIARMALWNGRKKISKTVTRKLNESPLLYELAVTRAQLEKSALIYLPNDDSLSFTIEVWQELDNSKIIHVTGKSLSGTKVTQSQMIPMFSYFTSFCQNLLKKLTNFIDTNIH